MGNKLSDFRYKAGPREMSWVAAGESYNADDLMGMVKFLLQGEGDAHDSAIASVHSAVKYPATIGTAPSKFSLGDKILQLEQQVDTYLGVEDSSFVPSATSGFEIVFRYASPLKGV